MNFFAKIASGISSKMSGIVTAVQSLTKTQAIIAGIATVTAVGGLSVGGYAVYDHFSEPEIVAEIIVSTEPPSEIESETTSEEEIVAAVEEVEVTEVAEAAEPVEVHLTGSSIEKDLKVKIQNDSSKNIKGQPFEITVKKDEKKAKETTYDDHDQDGIIYIKDIEAGDYVVTLKEIEGFTIEKDSITVTVKDKIEYVEVEIADEIKDESEVSAAEDVQVENVVVEAEIKDTVALVSSTCTPQTVPASDVDTSGFAVMPSVGTSTVTSFTQSKLTTTAKVNGYRTTENVLSTETKTTDGTPSTEVQGNGTGTSVTATIVHTFDDGSEVVTETVTAKGNEVTTAKSFAGYSTDSNGTFTLTENNQSFTIEWKKLYSYTIKHTFDGVEDTTKAENGTNVSGTVVTATNHAGDKYETKDSLQKTITADANANVFVIAWTSKEVAAKTMSMTLPSTATLYTTSDAAKTTNLALAISDVDKITSGNVTWKSDNENVVKVSNGSNTGCTITAVGKGSANVTATIQYKAYTNSETLGNAVVTCNVTVSDSAVGSSSDTTAVLKDKSGNTLYTDSACTKVATVADYSATGTYYTNPKYTGWQTLDGKVYYFDSNGNKVTGTQIISGITYNFGNDGALVKGTSKNGIDVSKWQGNIDWPTVAAAGIDFAIIRVGYRGSQTGVLVEDPYFQKNIKGATAAGIKVGVYFFTQAITEAEAVEEASMCLALTSGYNLSYPIFIDTESGSRANGLDKATRTACISAFCKTIQNGGRTAGIYASKSWFEKKLDMSQLNGYCIWVAQYNTECTYSGKYSIWQYSSKGSVPGIKGNVDVNKSYM